MNVISNTWSKLRNKKYRDAFVAAQLKRGIPFQISAMRKKLGWSQEQLAEAAGVTQGVISRAENPNYGNLTFNTVLRIAAGLDMAFVGWFVPFSKLTERFDNLTEESVQVPTFEEEDKVFSGSVHGTLNISLGDVTLKSLGTVENSTSVSSQVTTTKEIVEALKPNVSPAELIARASPIAARKASSAQESAEDQRHAA